MARTYLPHPTANPRLQHSKPIFRIRVALFLIHHARPNVANQVNLATIGMLPTKTFLASPSRTVMEMDEAPTSSTSLRAGTLHISQDPKQVLERRYHRRTSSFPTSLSFRTSLSLNIFRKNKDRSPKAATKASNKVNPEPNDTAPNAEGEEPYEVAPGIWSNEATAKVFGYLDNTFSQTKGKNYRRKERSESAGPSLYHRKNRSPSPGERLVQNTDVTRPECNRLASSSWRTYGRHTEESVKTGQGGTDQVEGVAGKVEARPHRGMGRDTSTYRTMRTVSKDDTLVARGANPRTGVVSPYATSESAESGYMTRGRREETAGWREKRTKDGKGMERTASGKWMQDNQGWSLVGSRAMTPVAQSVGTGLEKRRSSVPVEELQDRFVVNMPSAKEPAPLQLSREQIAAYQRSVERACRDIGGIQALVDPETLPTPRVMTPEGPSTPPRRLEKIKRKEVGSAVSQRRGSTDTVIIRSQARASSMPTPRKEQQRHFRARVISPGNTVLDVSKQGAGHSNDFEHQGDPFLGVRQDARSYQTNATPSPSHQTRYAENHQHHLNHSQSGGLTDTVTYAHQSPSQSLMQRLPPVNLVHPRQASIPRPKPSDQNLTQSQNVPLPTTISTAITTPITTTTTPLHPCLPRLDGTNSGPQANLPQAHLQQAHLPQRRTPKVRFQPAAAAAFAASSDSTSRHHQRAIVEPRNQAKSGMPLSLVAGHPQRPKTEANRNASTYASGSLPLPDPCQRANDLNLDLGAGSKVRMQRGERSASGPAVQDIERVPRQPITDNGHGDIRIRGKRMGEGAVAMDRGNKVRMSNIQATTGAKSRGHANSATVNSSFRNENHVQLSNTTPTNSHSSDEVLFGEKSADSCLSPAPITTTTTTSTDRGPRPTLTEHEASPPTPSLLTTLHTIRDAAHLLERNLHFSFSRVAADAFVSLLQMNQHVLATLHPSSRAIGVLTLCKGHEGAGLEEWVRAIRDVVLAALYLVVLGAVLGVVGRVLGWVCRCVLGVWAFGRGVLGWGRWVLGV